MPRFQPCPKEVENLAQSVLEKHESHRPLIDMKVSVAYLFAYGDTDEETGEPLNDALNHHGQKCLGICSITSKKDRALGQKDALIRLDGDWWAGVSEKEQEALLDHELHHLAIKTTKGAVQFDDLGRPILKMRKHDFQVGWFKCIAERNGEHSQEQIQARLAFDMWGQSFWPQLTDGNAGVVKSK
jgi:hypothetical protein